MFNEVENYVWNLRHKVKPRVESKLSMILMLSNCYSNNIKVKKLNLTNL